MACCTRRRLLSGLAWGAASILATPLLVACGQPATTMTLSPVPQRAGSLATPATPGTPRVAASPVVASPVATLVATVPPTPTIFTRPAGYGCPIYQYPTTPNPGDPYSFVVAIDGVAISFAETVRVADLIVLIDHRNSLAPLWTTANGQRPANPHVVEKFQYTIITPERAEVVKVVKGDYELPLVYFERFGGAIGQDCVQSSYSPEVPVAPGGTQFLYLASLARYPQVRPVADDARYRFYTASRVFPVSSEGMITIKPVSDIVGHRYDDPPRTLSVDAVLREIAAILATPAATPTR